MTVIDVSKINRERVQLFVDALKSDRFKQGTSRLTTILPNGDERHCCLGVACVIAMENGLSLHVLDVFGAREYDGEQCYLPPAAAAWYGFSYRSPLVYMPDEDAMESELRVCSAAGLNDAGGLDFATIGAALERTYINPVEQTT